MNQFVVSNIVGRQSQLIHVKTRSQYRYSSSVLHRIHSSFVVSKCLTFPFSFSKLDVLRQYHISQFHQVKRPMVSLLKREYSDIVQKKQFIQQYSQSDIDNYFIDKNIEDYRKVDVISMMKSAGKRGAQLSIDKHLHKISEFLKTSSERFGSNDVSSMIYGLGTMKSKDITQSEDYEMLILQITSKIVQMKGAFNSVNISSIFMGLKSMRGSSHAVCLLVDALVPKLDASRDPFSEQTVGNVLYGLQNMSSENIYVQRMLEILLPKIASCNQMLSAQAVGNSLYGLQNMKSDNIQVQRMLEILLPKIASCNQPLSAQEVGNALYGLKNMSSDNSYVEHMLEALVPKIASCNQPLSAQAVGNALYGLQNMKSDNINVQRILEVLVPKIASCNQPLGAQAVGNALYGLKNMSSDNVYVERMLEVLVLKIASCNQPLGAQNVSNALYGLKNMNNDCIHVQRMLEILVLKIASCNQPLDAQNVGNALYGLKNMNNDCIHVQRMLEVLVPKIASCNQPLSAQEVSNTLYGLQNMSSDDIHVQRMLEILVLKIQSCNQPLSAQNVSNALYGLKNMSSDDIHVHRMLEALLPKIKSCNQPLDAQAVGNVLYGLQNMTKIPSGIIEFIEKELMTMSMEWIEKFPKYVNLSDVRGLYQSILLTCTSLKDVDNIDNIENNSVSSITSPLFNQLSKSGGETIEKLKSVLRLYIEGPEMMKFQNIRRISQTERKYVNEIEKELMSKYPSEFAKGEATIERNVLLFGFECDMIFRLKGQPIINYEIDDTNHLVQKNKMKKKTICQMRDAYLEKVHDVKIIRKVVVVLNESNAKKVWRKSDSVTTS